MTNLDSPERINSAFADRLIDKVSSIIDEDLRDAAFRHNHLKRSIDPRLISHISDKREDRRFRADRVDLLFGFG